MSQPAVSAASGATDASRRGLLELQAETFTRQKALLDACFEEIRRAAAASEGDRQARDSEINAALRARIQRLSDELESQRLHAADLEAQTGQKDAENAVSRQESQRLRGELNVLCARHEQLLLRARRMRAAAVELKQELTGMAAALEEKNQIIIRLSALRQEMESQRETYEEQLVASQERENQLLEAVDLKNSQIQQLEIPHETDFHEEYGNLMKQCREFNDEIERLKADKKMLEKENERLTGENEQLRRKGEVECEKMQKEAISGGPELAAIEEINQLIKQADASVVFPAAEEYEDAKLRYAEVDFAALEKRCPPLFEAQLSDYKTHKKFTHCDQQDVIHWIKRNIDLGFSAPYDGERVGSLLFDGDSSEVSAGEALVYLVFLMWLEDLMPVNHRQSSTV